MNGLLYNALSARMSGVEARMPSLENTLTARFDLMIGKLADLGRHLDVLEDRSKR